MAPESSLPSQNQPPSAGDARHIPMLSGNPSHKNENYAAGDERIISPWMPLLPPANKRLIKRPASAPAMTGEPPIQAEPEPGQLDYRPACFDNDTTLGGIQRRDAAAEDGRERLLGGIDLARATLFSVSHNRRVTMLEGALARTCLPSRRESHTAPSAPCIGENVYEVLNRLRLKPRKEQLPPFFEPLESVLNGKTLGASQYRAYFQTLIETPRPGRGIEDIRSEGVTGLIVDLTALDSHTAAQLRSDCGEFTAQRAAWLEKHVPSSTSHGVQASAIGVASMARLLLSDKTLRGDQRIIATRLYGLAQELLAMVNDRLNPSTAEPERLNTGYMQFSVSRAIRAVLNHLRPAAEAKGLAFRTQVADKIASGFEVMGDPIQLQQVMVNLLSNSLRFTTRGYVKFSLEEEQDRPNSTVLKFKVEDTSRFAERGVMDWPSITPHFNCSEGGLGDSKAVVEAMQGRMTLDTSWGVGTTITVWIPFKKAPSEDDIISQKLTMTLIEQLGFQAAAACNGSEVLVYIKSSMLGHKPKPGIILMDLRMPFIDGYQCANILRHRTPYREYVSDIPIVAVAASVAPKEEEEWRCKSAGMDEFLPKPLTIDALERVFVRWVTCGRQA
ncbi:uncharacterized protein P884DRAFT_204441 [Thermothelomyces heterothallicus CBS 202.75]|uniref:uncharacterized protein n=1 Tax=Thermothelomyces heterothallicus CBS 202.75 TaxID=1149848 RepID=UPI00374312FF